MRSTYEYIDLKNKGGVFMNSKRFNIVLLFGILFLMLALNSQIAFAGGIGGNDNLDFIVYDITMYKKDLNQSYVASEGAGRDYVCSSGILQSEVECDWENDPTVHRYHAWKIMKGLKLDLKYNKHMRPLLHNEYRLF